MRRRNVAWVLAVISASCGLILWILAATASAGAYIGRGNDEVYFALDEGRIEIGWDFVEGGSSQWDRRGAHWNWRAPQHGELEFFAPFAGELEDFPQATWMNIPAWTFAFVGCFSCVLIALRQFWQQRKQAEQAVVPNP